MLEELRPRGPFARGQRVLHVDVLPITEPQRSLPLTFPATVPLAAQSAFLSRPVWTNVRHQMLSTYQG